MDFNFTGESISKKDFLLTNSYSFSDKELCIVGYNGEIKTVKKIPTRALDFKQISENRYCYLSADAKFNVGANGVYHGGSLIILDENLEVVKSGIRAKSFGSIMYDDYPIQTHDVIVLDDNHYFLMTCSFINHPIYNKIINCIVQEQINDEVVWQFETADYEELFNYPLIKYDYDNIFHKLNIYNDYAHMNSIELTDEGKSLLINYRNIGLVKIDIETKQIIYILGKQYTNLNLNNLINQNDLFCFQHDIRLINDNTISLFNNNGTRILDKNYYSAPDDARAEVIKLSVDGLDLVSYERFKTNNEPVRVMGGTINIKDNIFDIYYGTKGNVEEYNFDTKEQYLTIDFNGASPLYRIERGI